MRFVLVIALSGGTAFADDALHARVEAEAEKTWLDIDPVFAPQLEGLTVGEREVVEKRYKLDRKTVLRLELDQWTNQGDRALPALDVRAQGWHASVRISRDLGFATLSLGASLADIDSQFGFGRYYEIGASLLRTVELSNGRKAWYGLTAGRRKWLVDDDQQPPAGEANAMQLMFVFGFTF
ncbi:MAG: hypothetical protein H0V17_32245 [Deltaproteobacteria bacterium]|nr:hypothetical protein [Deltaproteobacteria bacterium]